MAVELVQVELGEPVNWLLADFSGMDRGCAQGGCVCQGACHQAVTKLSSRRVFIFALHSHRCRYLLYSTHCGYLNYYGSHMDENLPPAPELNYVLNRVKL
jgi:hypothetical protein